MSKSHCAEWLCCADVCDAEKGCASTYNGTEMDRKTPTYGGYSTSVVVNEHFVCHVSPKLDILAAAPLLCAGITTWSPLKKYNVGKGSRVAVVGLGGLGHMGVKLAAALGAEVTLFSTSKSKEADRCAGCVVAVHDMVSANAWERTTSHFPATPRPSRSWRTNSTSC